MQLVWRFMRSWLWLHMQATCWQTQPLGFAMRIVTRALWHWYLSMCSLRNLYRSHQDADRMTGWETTPCASSLLAEFILTTAGLLEVKDLKVIEYAAGAGGMTKALLAQEGSYATGGSVYRHTVYTDRVDDLRRYLGEKNYNRLTVMHQKHKLNPIAKECRS